MSVVAEALQDEEIIAYRPVPTIDAFHMHPGQIRGIVGPVGSGKTTGATWDICRYLPSFVA